MRTAERRPTGAKVRAPGRCGRPWAGWPVLMLIPCLWSLVPPAAGADAVPAATDATDALPLERTVSRMWEPVAAIGGRLSNDQSEDVVVVLHRRDAIPNDMVLPVGSRGLAIFSRDPQGSYYRSVLLEGVLPCVLCLGTVSRDPQGVPFEIDISDRQLTISWIGNEDGFVFVRLVLAWDAKERAFGLIEDEVVRADGRGMVKSRRTRDYRAGRAQSDGQVTEFAPHFVPADRIQAADYR